MRRFFENRIAFAATVLAFAMALAVSAVYGNGIALPSSSPLPEVQVSMNALPGLPPFECDGCPPPAASLMASARGSQCLMLENRFLLAIAASFQQNSPTRYGTERPKSLQQ